MDNRLEIVKEWQVDGEEFSRAIVIVHIGENKFEQELMLPLDDAAKKEALDTYFKEYQSGVQINEE